MQQHHRKLVDEHPLLVLPSLATALGLNEALLLQQLHFMLQTSSHVHEGRRWVYNTYDQWQQVFPFWKPRMLRTILTDLEKLHLLLSRNFNKSPADRTKWYTIEYEQLSHVTESVTSTDIICQMDWQKMSDGLAENVSSDQRLSSKTFFKEECHPYGDAKCAGVVHSTVPNPSVREDVLPLLFAPSQGEPKASSPKPPVIRTEYSPGFLAYHQAHPIKKGKAKAWELWQRKHLEPRADEIVQSVRNHITYDLHWAQGFIKQLDTYLSAECWDDVLDMPQTTKHTVTL